jgi:hypothetical protein
MKIPTQKEIEQLENAKSTFKDIIKVHMREPFDDGEIEFFLNNIKKLKKHNCSIYYTDDVSTGEEGDVVDAKRLMETLSKGYLILTAPQLQVRFLFVKVYGGKGIFWGKKIHYAAYQQRYDENIWTPLGNFKIWGLAVTGINNIFRSEGLLHGPAL